MNVGVIPNTDLTQVDILYTWKHTQALFGGVVGIWIRQRMTDRPLVYNHLEQQCQQTWSSIRGIIISRSGGRVLQSNYLQNPLSHFKTRAPQRERGFNGPPIYLWFHHTFGWSYWDVSAVY